MSESEKVRLHLEMSQKTRDQVEKLKELTGASSMAEVIRRAIDVYGEVVAVNGELVIITDDERENVKVIF